MPHRPTQSSAVVRPSRRKILGAASAAVTAGVVASATRSRAATPPSDPSKGPFTLGLNTSTVRGQKLGIVRVIDLAAKVGYRAMEPWLMDFADYTKSGGDLKDLKKRFVDAGIAVVDVIGFAPWMMGDEEANKKNLEQMKRDMEICAQVGAVRIAAPPAGATQLLPGLGQTPAAKGTYDLDMAAARYRAVLEIGEQIGVTPILEFWGPSKMLHNLAQAAYVAAASKHPKAAILTDVYHLYKGGSGYDGLKLIAGSSLPVMHMNDYPADPPRDKIKDEHRIYPGDGVAPMTEILKTLAANGARTALCLELFNKQYWEQDAEVVLKTGLEKMQAAVGKALG